MNSYIVKFVIAGTTQLITRSLHTAKCKAAVKNYITENYGYCEHMTIIQLPII